MLKIKKIENDISVIKLQDILLHLRDYCIDKEINDGQVIDFSNNEGNHFIFEFDDKKQSISKNDNKWYYRKYNDYNFHDNTRNIDFTFINKFDTFIIEELEEFTFFIIEIIINKLSNKKILCLDEKINKLYKNEQVGYLRNIEDVLLFDVGKICYINSYNWSYDTFSSKKLRAYNSRNVFHSLIWAQYVEHLGNNHPDKVIYLIDYNTAGAGLMDIIKYTAAHVLLARDRNWIPVICLNKKPNQYLNNAGENMWEYLFEPVSKISYDEALSCANVIRASVNDIRLNDTEGNIYLNEYAAKIYESILSIDNNLFTNAVKVKKEILSTIDEIVPNTLSCNNKVLGVICRGTDYSKEANEKIGRIHYNASIEKMLEVSEKILLENNFDYIFLATEDSNYLKLFKDKFADKLLFIEQKRVTYNYKDNPYKGLCELLNIQDGEKFAIKYLSVLYALSKCNALISSIYCGAYQGAIAFSDHEFKLAGIVK